MAAFEANDAVAPVDAQSENKPGDNRDVKSDSNKLVDVIRDLILSGKISSTISIRQDALASQLQVSKIPLREALARLEQDGLVILQPNRGYFIRPLSAKEAEEIYALRLQLEPDAVAQGALKATEAEQIFARRTLELLDSEAARQPSRLSALHRAFHIALVQPGDREILSDMLMRLHVLADRYVHKHLEPKGRHLTGALEHQEMYDAWAARRVEDVKAITRLHLQRTLDDLRSELSSVTSSTERSPGPAPRLT